MTLLCLPCSTILHCYFSATHTVCSARHNMHIQVRVRNLWQVDDLLGIFLGRSISLAGGFILTQHFSHCTGF